MFRNKISTVLIATALIVIGLGSGLIIAAAFTSSATTAPVTNDWKAEMAALDARIAELPAQQQAFVLVARKATPAVVTISSERVVQVPRSRFQVPEELQRFFDDDSFPDRQPREQRQQGLGSGVIVDPGGIILTNNHVVEQADTIQVTLPDNRTVDAEVVGTDPDSDLAVIRIKEKGLPYVAFGDSDAIEVGEWVLAIGNPFSESLRHTVTAGIVSAKGRSVNLNIAYEDFIQTDAAINPGNSGGALVNMKGELVGINSVIASRTGTFSGVGFAIPSNLAKQVMQSLLEHGRVIRGWLGVTIQSTTNEIASALGLDSPRGALVVDVSKDSPAEKAGLRRGDLVLTINGEEVASSQDLTNRVGGMAPGSDVRLQVQRESGPTEVTIILGERPANLAAGGESPSSDESESLLGNTGLLVRELTPEMAQRLGYEGEQGVVIVDVRGGSVAERAGLREGYLIQEINRNSVRSMDDFNNAMKDIEPGDNILFYVRAGSGGGYFALQVPNN